MNITTVKEARDLLWQELPRKQGTQIGRAMGIAARVLERQIPRRAYEDRFHDCSCPVCHTVISLDDRYCWLCGQRLEWLDELKEAAPDGPAEGGYGVREADQSQLTDFDKEKVIQALHKRRLGCEKMAGINVDEEKISFYEGGRSAFLAAIEIVKKGGA